MVNKREGYKRVANVLSVVGALAFIIPWVVGIYLDPWVNNREISSPIAAGFLGIIFTAISYYTPQAIYKVSCYIADGFKGQP